MGRPHIICHMVTSLDGRVTGDFLSRAECAKATELYYRLNREWEADGFICGRVTMEESFTGGFYPDLSRYKAVEERKDFVAEGLLGRYAIAFDTNGKLGWRSDRIIDPDGDPGYDGARIVEVLSERVDGRYLGYLREMRIPYLFAGESSIDVGLALSKLKELFGCNTLLLEGGSILNGAFERAGAVDELSLLVAPIVADKESKPLFMDAEAADFVLADAKVEQGVLALRYGRKDHEV